MNFSILRQQQQPVAENTFMPITVSDYLVDLDYQKPEATETNSSIFNCWDQPLDIAEMENSEQYFTPVPASAPVPTNMSAAAEIVQVDLSGGRASVGMPMPDRRMSATTPDTHGELNLEQCINSPTDTESLTDELLMHEELQDLCPETRAALDAARQCGAATPLVKEELRCRIHMRRQNEGKQELQVDWTPRKPEALSECAQKRRDERKERNRMAAQKCRAKKRQMVSKLQQQVNALTSDKAKLERQIAGLQQEYKTLREILERHAHTCSSTRIPNSQH